MDTLNLDEISPEGKSTAFWVQYRDHHGNNVASDKKAWVEHFMVDAESGKGKTDLNFTLRIEEPPSTELRNWLESDVFIELY